MKITTDFYGIVRVRSGMHYVGQVSSNALVDTVSITGYSARRHDDCTLDTDDVETLAASGKADGIKFSRRLTIMIPADEVVTAYVMSPADVGNFNKERYYAQLEQDHPATAEEPPPAAEGMNFAEAWRAVMDGKRVYRASWGGRFTVCTLYVPDQNARTVVRQKKDGVIVDSNWRPDVRDMLATDWCVHD